MYLRLKRILVKVYVQNYSSVKTLRVKMSVSPSDLATKTAQQLSLSTLTVVLHMSRILSTAKKRPIPSTGRPQVSKMMIKATRLAAGIPATPIEVSKERTTIETCAEMLKSIPYTCAINKAATHSYRADPDMFKDVPKGTTRLQIRLEMPALFSKQSMVMGKEAEEELVEKAVIRAGDIALK